MCALSPASLYVYVLLPLSIPPMLAIFLAVFAGGMLLLLLLLLLLRAAAKHVSIAITHA